MRKSIKSAAVIAVSAFMIFMLSGCVQMVIGVNITRDGAADISVKTGILNSVYDMLSENGDKSPVDETRSEAENNGYSIEEYTEGDYRGVIMTKRVDNLSEAADSDKYIEGVHFSKEKSGLKQTMSLRGTLVNADSFKKNMKDSNIDISQADMKLVVSVPYAITKTNATSVSSDNRTATFDLVQLDEIELECEGDIMLFGAVPMTAAAIVVAVIAIGAVVLIVVGFIKKKRTEKENDAAGQE